MRIESAINPRKIGLILGLIAFYLAAQSLFNEYLLETYVGGDSNTFLALLLNLFSVNLEESIPTWYATLNLFIAAGLLAVIAVGKRASRDRDALYWVGLAIIFVYLSVDEGAAIHEIFSNLIEDTLHTSGFLSFGWLVVAAPLVAVLGLFYLRFLLHLPVRTRNLLILAGALYIGGAMGVESISANQFDLGGGVTLLYLAIGTIEELAEMLGIVVLIYTLLAYIIEMQYTVAFQPQTTLENTVSGPSRWARLLGIVAVIVIIAGNVALYASSLAQAPTAEATPENSTLTYQILIDELVTPETVVTHTPGVFGAESLISRRVAAAMLDLFGTVMVVALPEFDSSIIIAADTLPFDQEGLSEVLHASGKTQFIIFDTPVVRVIAGSTPASSAP